MALPPKLCPRCGEEYVHTTQSCAECGVALVDELPHEASGASLPPVEELVCLRAAGPAWAHRLSDRLEERGIPHRIEPVTESASGPGLLGVFVLREQREDALEVDREHLATEMPDLPDELEAAPPDEGVCPACGDPLDASSDACPGCGLALAPEA